MAQSACPAALAVVQEEWGRVGNGSNRVIRGGSFNNEAVNMRSAKRNNNTPGNRNANIGGRCLSPLHRPPSPAGLRRDKPAAVRIKVRRPVHKALAMDPRSGAGPRATPAARTKQNDRGEGWAVRGERLLLNASPVSTRHPHIRPGVELAQDDDDVQDDRNRPEPEHNEEVLKQEAVVDATS